MKDSSIPGSGKWWRVVKLVGAGLVVLATLAAGTGYARFASRRARAYDEKAPALTIASDAATLARGEHLARTLGVAPKCHGADFGGRVMGDEPVMRLVAPNLTPGTGSATRGYTDRDWARAIVHGVNRSGRSLMVMPSPELARLADDDIAAVIAFMKSVPAVAHDLGRTDVTLLGHVVFGLTGADVLSAEGVDHAPRRREAPPVAATQTYGEYLSTMCRGCHGPDMRGGIVLHPGAPPSADLSPAALVSWDFAAFERALRTGVGRDGHTLNEAMPWIAMRDLTPDEMRALWLGLRQD